MVKAKAVDPDALKRESPGSYRTGDGRFTAEQDSGRWMVVDAEQHDDLGLPLVRGPFETLGQARAAIAQARSEPAPASHLAQRRQARPSSTAADSRTGTSKGRASAGEGLAAAGKRPAGSGTSVPEAPPAPQPVEIRRYERGDGPALRAFWATLEFSSVGDDDDSLDRLADRNPGLALVAIQGDRIVGTALGAWDGRRGWIYHVGTAADHRRQGLGRRLVRDVERKLRQVGCPRVNVVVRDERPDAVAFWESLGYTSTARQFGHEI
jgi:ribosomal protein S18 acetylase RimI-like enzyme